MRWLILIGLLLTACLPQAEQAAAPSPTPPFYAPDFALAALDGTSYHLAELRGRWVLLNFWATWCAPCVEEMPLLQQLADDHPESLLVLGINQREDAALVADFARDHGLRFPLLLNPPDGIVLDYNIMGLPQSLLIDPQGIVVYRAFGVLDMQAVQALLPAS